MKVRSRTSVLFITLLFALFSGAPSSWGYTNPIEGGSTEAVTNLWSLTSNLYVGSNTTDNALFVISGGQVIDEQGYIGFMEGADNNTVLVTDAGSVWSNSYDLSVGHDGSHNTMTIGNNGHVNSENGIVGYGASAWPSNNSVYITGTGSVWNISADDQFADFLLGRDGWGNILSIENGGQLYDDRGYIGFYRYSSNNMALVAGSGSVWSNSYGVSVGNNGSSNSLTIADGGLVYCLNDSSLGDNEGSDNNTVLVTGAGSVWEILDAFHVGWGGSGNSLIISDGGQIYSEWGYVGDAGSADNNTVLVAGTGSVWSALNNLYVGNAGPGNMLTITNRGQVNNLDGYVGYEATANSNKVTVTGSGSVWDNSGHLEMGVSGSGNLLRIENSGEVSTEGWSSIGSSGGSENEILVTGSGSVWNAYAFVVGGESNASGNTLTITNGGLVTDRFGWIGGGENASSNTVLVTGTGSVWDSWASIAVGNWGSGNTLRIENGGRVESEEWSDIGRSGGFDNAVLVTGTGSVWDAHAFMVGGGGSGNSLMISNGGMVTNRAQGWIGYAGGASNNTVLVTGTGSLWGISGWMRVGNYGSGNMLRIENGGEVYAGGWNALGYETGSDNNTVELTGSGSCWYADGLEVGRVGSGNMVKIEDGGTLTSGWSSIGTVSGSDSNTVQITGSGSSWHAVRIEVGKSCAGNKLIVTDGAAIDCDGTLSIENELLILGGARAADTWGYIGLYTNSADAEALVMGTGSTWYNRETMWLGGFDASYWGGADWVDQGPGSLTVSNGGWVLVGVVATNPLPDIGAHGGLIVGGTNYPEMVVANGSVVNSDYGYIGFDAAQTGSMVVIGNGSVWSNHLDMYVGNDGVGNSLMIANYGVVSAASATIRSNNTAILQTGGTLALTGTLTCEAGATLEIDIGGDAVSDYGHCSVGGLAALSGILDVVLLDGYSPPHGTSFDLFDWDGGISGSFASVKLPPLSFGLVWNTNMLYTTGNLSIEYSTLDLDGDGIPDGWEAQCFGGDISPTNNPDFDPLNNLEEFIAGCDPTDPTSYFAITNAEPAEAGFVIQWAPCISNRWYGVNWTADLSGGMTSLATHIEFPQNSYTDTAYAADSHGFYQVEVQMK